MYWERLVPGTEAVFGTVIMTPGTVAGLTET